MSDSLRPHGLQPKRLLCPWDFPGKNTGVGCHFLLQVIAVVIVIAMVMVINSNGNNSNKLLCKGFTCIISFLPYNIPSSKIWLILGLGDGGEQGGVSE